MMERNRKTIWRLGIRPKLIITITAIYVILVGLFILTVIHNEFRLLEGEARQNGLGLSSERLKQRFLDMRSKGIKINVVSLIIGAGVAGILAWQMTRPLGRLMLATRKISQGDLSQRVKIRTGDEFEELGEAFNQMADELQQLYASMEHKIEERTRELRESEEFTQLLFDSLPELLIVQDTKFNILRTNRKAKELFGEDALSEQAGGRAGLVGKKCYHIFHNKDDICGECPVKETIETQKPAHLERAEPNPKTGEIFVIDAYPIFDKDGKLKAVLESAKIVTEQRLLQAQLIQQEKLAGMGLMAAGIAHEIGNPLTSLSNLIQLLQREVNNDAFKSESHSIRSDLRSMEEQIDMIQRIVRDISDFARPADQQWQYTQVNDIVKAAIGFTKYDKRTKRIRIVTDLNANLPLIRIIDEHLLQVFTNIILNAFDAMEEGGRLTISTFARDDSISVSFADTGAGIAEQNISRVFEPFYTTKPSGKGTGLGLSVSYGIVKNFGGTIEVESEENKGTVFIVVLSLAAPDSETQRVRQC